MSQWTHITACFSIETYRCANRTELKNQIKALLHYMPKITGSEQDADVFINIPSGYNVYIGQDCAHCKYQDSLKEVEIDGKPYQECDGPEGHNCSKKYQTRVVISIQGDLRDRNKEITQKEFDKVLKYLNDKFWIRDYAVNIDED